tara:strand:+ start:80 stop:346 length:267 start_codon:yes stop_codon:yes gene_type:complete
MTIPPHDVMILGEKDMEDVLYMIEDNLKDNEKSVFNIYLPSIKWVNIILDNVNTIGEKVLDPDNVSTDLLTIEFIIEGDDHDEEPDYE